METITDTKPDESAAIQVCHLRLIYVGGHTHSFRELFLKPLCSVSPGYHIRGYVLDFSTAGGLEEAVKTVGLSKEIKRALQIRRAPLDDEAALKSLWRLTSECDPSSLPNEVMLDVHPGDFPEVAAACRILASKRFFGNKREQLDNEWPFESLPDETDLEDLRARLAGAIFPRRLSALLVGPPPQRDLFLSQLPLTPWAWLSFVQLAESTERLEELWPWVSAPDLFFCTLESFGEFCRQERYGRAVCIVAANNPQGAVQSVLDEGAKDAAKRVNYPAVVVVWSPRSARKVRTAWVTRPLERGGQPLPQEGHYNPRRELESQIEDVWRKGRPGVVGLIGAAGSGKTALLHHLLRACQTTREAVKPKKENDTLPTADALFVWDFNAQQFPGRFLRSLAEYLNPGELGAASGEECLTLIRHALRGRHLRRTLLVLDGLEIIQRPAREAASEGEFQSEIVRKLLGEVAAGELPAIIILSTSLELSDIKRHAAGGYTTVRVGKLSIEEGRRILRDCGVVGTDARLDTLVERFNHHPMTVYHLGRLLGDFCNGDPSAADSLPVVARTFQPAGVREGDKVSRGIMQLFGAYEGWLAAGELAVLKRVATLVLPVSVAEFAQVFPESGDEQLTGELVGMTTETLQPSFDALQARHLLNVYKAPGEAPRYAAHPTLSDYFTRAYLSDSLGRSSPGARASTRSEVRTRGTVRTRGAAFEARGARQEHPTDPAILDLLEKILIRAARAGLLEEARLFYQRRMGGDRHLQLIGQQQRSRRIKTRLDRSAE